MRREVGGEWTGQQEVIASGLRLHSRILVWYLEIRSVSKVVGFPFPSPVQLGGLRGAVGAGQVG